MISVKFNVTIMFFLLYSNYVSCMESKSESDAFKKLALLQSYRYQSPTKQIKIYNSIKENNMRKEKSLPFEFHPLGGNFIQDKIGISPNSENPSVYVIDEGEKKPSFSRYEFKSGKQIASVELPVETPDLFYFDFDTLDNKAAICAAAFSGNKSSKNTFIIDLEKNSIDNQLPLNCNTIALCKDLNYNDLLLAGAPIRSQNEITLINLETKEPIHIFKFKGHRDIINSIASDREYILASASNDKTVKTWSLVTGNLHHTYKIDSAVQAVTIDHHGKIISTADRSTDVLDIETGKKEVTLKDSKLNAWCWTYPRAACSPDGNYIAQVIGADMEQKEKNELIIWDKRTGDIVRKFALNDLREFSLGNNGAVSFDPSSKKVSVITNFGLPKQFNINQSDQLSVNSSSEKCILQ